MTIRDHVLHLCGRCTLVSVMLGSDLVNVSIVEVKESGRWYNEGFD